MTAYTMSSSRTPAVILEPAPPRVSSRSIPSGVETVMRSSYCTNMRLDLFLSEREPDWNRLAAMCEQAGRRAESLGAEGVRTLGALYRAAAADLAIARRRFRSDPVVRMLEDLVGRARHLVYDVRPRRETFVDFMTRGYWRRIGERPVLLLVSAVLLFVPAALAVWWAV